MTERERIGCRLAELRNQKGLSQIALAELSGVGHSHIARIEMGRYSVGIDTLAKLADALDMQLDFTGKQQH